MGTKIYKMKLTKDECAILAAIVYHGKYELNQELNPYSKKDSILIMETMQILEEKLTEAGRDERRFGRTSQNSITDIFKRLAKKYQSLPNGFL
ncbi:hypothetical protein EGH90_12460 [Kaistella haifensis]|nr:hypothetical protein EGH90_12460 [Kaistella haifensis]